MAGAVPQILLGELTALSQILWLDLRGLLLRREERRDGGSRLHFSADLCPWSIASTEGGQNLLSVIPTQPVYVSEMVSLMLTMVSG